MPPAADPARKQNDDDQPKRIMVERWGTVIVDAGSSPAAPAALPTHLRRLTLVRHDGRKRTGKQPGARRGPNEWCVPVQARMKSLCSARLTDAHQHDDAALLLDPQHGPVRPTAFAIEVEFGSSSTTGRFAV
jgi:hypothetical protein